MPRIPITLPESLTEWYALPKAFLDFVDQVDEARSAMEAGSFGSYRWDVDSDGPLSHLIQMWNDGDDLSPEEAVKAIQEGVEERDMEAWAVSRYL